MERVREEVLGYAQGVSVETITCEIVDEPTAVYNLTIEGDPSYVAGGLIVHNCASCQALDGKTFDVDKGSRPPRHINCRCSTVPVLRSFRELGLPFEDYSPSTRASMNGQVPASETYNSWLKRMPPSIQDEALGPNRGRLFRSGEIDVQDFVDKGGDPWNLDELAKREKAAWSKANL